MLSTLDDVDWPLRTERLTIRRSVAADAETTYRWRKLPEVYAWTTNQDADFDAYRERFLEEKRLASTLVFSLDDALIGDLMLRIEDAWAQDPPQPEAERVQAELGWTLDPAYGGKGLATEAVAALIDLSFLKLGLRRVTANCFADNEASWRLMERLGMRREAHLVRESRHRSGAWLDGLTYALLADEWPPSPTTR